MALNKIYRGGVHRTTPETLEVNYTGAATLQPGHAVAQDAGNGLTTAVGAGTFFYVLGELLHGGIDDDLTDSESTLRMYSPRSGDLYAGRAAAGIDLVDDMPLTINGSGQFAAAGEEDAIHAYVNWPVNSSLTFDGPTVANQLIPIKIK